VIRRTGRAVYLLRPRRQPLVDQAVDHREVEISESTVFSSSPGASLAAARATIPHASYQPSVVKPAFFKSAYGVEHRPHRIRADPAAVASVDGLRFHDLCPYCPQGRVPPKSGLILTFHADAFKSSSLINPREGKIRLIVFILPALLAPPHSALLESRPAHDLVQGRTCRAKSFENVTTISRQPEGPGAGGLGSTAASWSEAERPPKGDKKKSKTEGPWSSCQIISDQGARQEPRAPPLQRRSLPSYWSGSTSSPPSCTEFFGPKFLAGLADDAKASSRTR